ncbi:hypothetical protein [Evansella cellulosilytica]|uniref:Lipoprotein n=1 Tax=Evansella cellulosilytica (strain ATCC 21833 / DSM 2522 / FERM P-1141 / JCM 9156 / N-4) TaxID=649639 RepID=E6TRB2_EVAC2|nr:hypothetical protein [Evansella cellulosilytica]ADU30624.1 hypothetical protein Bcell_2365 [Evansella cellulosilytica DSM 2522]
MSKYFIYTLIYVAFLLLFGCSSEEDRNRDINETFSTNELDERDTDGDVEEETEEELDEVSAENTDASVGNNESINVESKEGDLVDKGLEMPEEIPSFIPIPEGAVIEDISEHTDDMHHIIQVRLVVNVEFEELKPLYDNTAVENGCEIASSNLLSNLFNLACHNQDIGEGFHIHAERKDGEAVSIRLQYIIEQ